MIATAETRAKAKADAKDSDNVVVEFLLLIGAALGVVASVAGLLIGLVVAASLVDTWVFTYIWRWFAVPLGLPALSYWAAFGLLLVVRLARPIDGEPEREGQGKVKNATARFAVRITLYPATVFALGAFAHHMLNR